MMSELWRHCPEAERPPYRCSLWLRVQQFGWFRLLRDQRPFRAEVRSSQRPGCEHRFPCGIWKATKKTHVQSQTRVNQQAWESWKPRWIQQLHTTNNMQQEWQRREHLYIWTPVPELQELWQEMLHHKVKLLGKLNTMAEWREATQSLMRHVWYSDVCLWWNIWTLKFPGNAKTRGRACAPTARGRPWNTPMGVVS